MVDVREPTIVVRGDVSPEMVSYARDKLLAIIADSASPVLNAELRLDHHADPARERPDHVEATIDVNGVPIRAHRNTRTMSEAVDRALTRLRRRVEGTSERQASRRLRYRDAQSWHHDDRPTERRDFFPRSRDERVIVRRKTFALEPESIEEALFDLETLDHEFFLFRHDETNAEAVVYRVGSGYGLRQRVPTPEAIDRVEIPLDAGPPPASTTIDDALSILDEADEPFDFFIDAATGLGLVAYRRYDGNYGIITAG